MEKKLYCSFCAARLTQRHTEGRQRLYCDTCERPIYENPLPATCLVVIDPCDRVLLVKRDVEPKMGQWCLPGGFIELDESAEQGALRELFEETGLQGKNVRLLGVRTTPSAHYQSILMVGFMVKSFDGAAIAGDDASDVMWTGYDQLPPIAFDSHRYFLKRCFEPAGRLVR